MAISEQAGDAGIATSVRLDAGNLSRRHHHPHAMFCFLSASPPRDKHLAIDHGGLGKSARGHLPFPYDATIYGCKVRKTTRT